MTENQSFLKQLDAIYIEIQEIKKNLENLKNVEQAQAEYDKLVAIEQSKLTNLQQQKRQLEIEQHSLKGRKHKVRQIINSPQQSNIWQTNTQQNNIISSTTTNKRKPELEAREIFKKQINRFYKSKLDAKVLGEINRIADDLDHPLGEALSLLDWVIFQDYANKALDDPSKLKLLKEWNYRLQEYHNHLSLELEMQENRFRDYIPIWKKWLTREESTQWQEFIDKTRQAMQVEGAKLEDEIRQLHEKMAQVKAARSQLGA